MVQCQSLSKFRDGDVVSITQNIILFTGVLVTESHRVMLRHVAGMAFFSAWEILDPPD